MELGFDDSSQSPSLKKSQMSSGAFVSHRLVFLSLPPRPPKNAETSFSILEFLTVSELCARRDSTTLCSVSLRPEETVDERRFNEYKPFRGR